MTIAQRIYELFAMGKFYYSKPISFLCDVRILLAIAISELGIVSIETPENPEQSPFSPYQ